MRQVNLDRLDEFIEWLSAWEAGLERAGSSSECWELPVVRGLLSEAVQARDRLDAAELARTGVTVVHVRRCRTQREVLRVYARLSGGRARLSDVAGLVVEAGLSRSDQDSVRSSLHHFVTDNPDEWALLGRGWVWLREFGPIPDDWRPAAG